jgi:glyoxylate utilization-related uncharacterized protein
MPQTQFIDTSALPRIAIRGGGEMVEILSDRLTGAKNVVGTLRYLSGGESLVAPADDRHQLLYLMEGRGSLLLEGRSHDVEKGMGLYLGPTEEATLTATEGASLKVFHLVVPKIPK